MVITQGTNPTHGSLTRTKSFLVWSFTLTVCSLVVGFPMLVLVATVTALAAIILQSLLPMSAVLVVVGSVVGFHVLGIFFGAALLTAKGVHPEDVSWLHWLHGKTAEHTQPVYAACPLTCDIVHT
ncbi:hypothetical protein VB712_12980 [Spirulina sp. CCNP1310]|uniref:hypothetical protein n=1 Tax=Spirulina sp. CCNP1310 TaxID=3110249 RepID=UPI002B1FDBC4|nr:hypothetical protein [Spirulina sp. CCNP1310]MEA5420137.1 hypothetical protein [Spirulina sp. CCNP1310]